MIYVIQTNKPFKYLSGISEDKKVITGHLNEFPEAIKLNSKLLTFEHLSYPFWILEKGEFQFLNDEELLEAIIKAGKKLKDDEDTFNLYKVTEELLADDGRDEMGMLDHHHFDCEEVKEVKKDGMTYLRRRFNIN